MLFNMVLGYNAGTLHHSFCFLLFRFFMSKLVLISFSSFSSSCLRASIRSVSFSGMLFYLFVLVSVCFDFGVWIVVCLGVLIVQQVLSTDLVRARGNLLSDFR